MYNESTRNEDGRERRTDQIVSDLLQLDQAWAQDVCHRAWDATSGLSQPAHAAAVHTATAHNPNDHTATIIRAADAASAAIQYSESHNCYGTYVWAYDKRLDEPAHAYVVKRQGALRDHGVPYDDFDQAACDVVLGYAVGCINLNRDVQIRIETSLHFAGRDEALDKVLEGIDQLKKACDTWTRQQDKAEDEKQDDPPATEASNGQLVVPEEEEKDIHLPSDDTTSQQLLIAALRGAIVCGMGMVLPVLWGTVVPWAWVLTGVCVGGVLGYRAALSRPSVSQLAWMLIGWAAMGLGASVASLGMLSLVASHGIALAIGVSATALCLGGLGSLWSQGIGSVAAGNSERTASPTTPHEHLSF